MTDIDPDGDGGGDKPPPTLSDRLLISRHGDGYAYRPGVVIVRGAAARTRLHEILPDADEERIVESLDISRMSNLGDPLALIEVLRSEGLDAQPEHVLFAHGCECECACGPHPADVHDLADGSWANPFRANPFRANPFRANPFRANPFRANPFRANGTPMSTAVPAFARELPVRTLEGPGEPARIVVLDTGLAGPDGGVDQRPPLLGSTMRITGVLDVADAPIGTGANVHPPDRYLDPVAGHGTFIAGLIEQLAPGCSIRVERVVKPLGDVDEGDVLVALQHEIDKSPEQRPDIISMSFGGHLSNGAFALRQLIADAVLEGIVVVASAGNDGTCLANYPAAFEGAIAVGAVGPDGPAPWTNYGTWVDACAPGVDLVSAFFARFDGALPRINSVDPDRFAGWARWSGTSFAAPVVVAALAREMVGAGCTAKEAVGRVIHAPHLMRIPRLGTVVNI